MYRIEGRGAKKHSCIMLIPQGETSETSGPGKLSTSLSSAAPLAEEAAPYERTVQSGSAGASEACFNSAWACRACESARNSTAQLVHAHVVELETAGCSSLGRCARAPAQRCEMLSAVGCSPQRRLSPERRACRRACRSTQLEEARACGLLKLTSTMLLPPPRILRQLTGSRTISTLRCASPCS